MTDIGDSIKENALHAIADMTARAQKAQAKFAVGSSQHTLQVNRIHALRVAEALVAQKPDAYTDADLERARAPLASLISKSEKAQGKLKEDSWQHRMLQNNLAALTLASRLLEARLLEEQA